MNHGENNKKSRRRLLVHPRTVILSTLIGALTGWLSPSFGHNLAPYGKLYLALLQMCILPLLITSMISSLGRVFSSGEAGQYLKRILAVFLAGIIVSGLLGIFLGAVGRPGLSLKESAKATVGKLLNEQESEAAHIPSESPGFLGFVKMMIPTNPFEAVMQGRNLPVVFFCLLFGIAVGLLRTPASATTLSVIETIFEAVLKMISWMMYVLPFGIFCIFASQVSDIGVGIFFALGRLILCVYTGAFLLICFYVFAIARSTRSSVIETLRALKGPIFMAMGTSSSYAAIPASLIALQDKLHVDRDMSKLVVPLGVSLNPQGSVLYFSLITVFMAQLYDLTLSAHNIFVILFGSIFISVSVSGVPAAAALHLVSIVLDPLGLPTETALILLLAIDPIMDPILTTINVLASCAATAVVGRQKKQ